MGDVLDVHVDPLMSVDVPMTPPLPTATHIDPFQATWRGIKAETQVLFVHAQRSKEDESFPAPVILPTAIKFAEFPSSTCHTLPVVDPQPGSASDPVTPVQAPPLKADPAFVTPIGVTVTIPLMYLSTDGKYLTTAGCRVADELQVLKDTHESPSVAE